MTDNIVKKTVGNLVTKMKGFGFLHSDDVVTSWNPTTSNSKYPTEKLVKDSIDPKENSSNKVTSLSSSSTDLQYPSAKAVYDALSEVVASSGGNYIYDFYHDTSTDEIVLEYDSASGGGSDGGSSSVDIVTSWEQTPSDSKVASEKLVKDTLDTKAESTHNHTKSQITDFPTIPTKTSDLTNDSNFITSHQSLANYIQKSNTQGLVKNDGTIDTSTYLTSHQSLTGYLKTTDVVDNLTSTSTTTPLSAKQGKELATMIGQAISYINQ